MKVLERLFMKLEWMGKYRRLVEMIIRCCNRYSQGYTKEYHYNFPVAFSPAQLQVMEYILENEEENQPMGEIAGRLGISQSAFSKNVKKMVEKGLLERYHMEGNKRTIIIKVSDLGREAYRCYSETIYEGLFRSVFEALDEIPDEYIERFTQAMEIAAGPKPEASRKKLVKIKE